MTATVTGEWNLSYDSSTKVDCLDQILSRWRERCDTLFFESVIVNLNPPESFNPSPPQNFFSTLFLAYKNHDYRTRIQTRILRTFQFKTPKSSKFHSPPPQPPGQKTPPIALFFLSFFPAKPQDPKNYAVYFLSFLPSNRNPYDPRFKTLLRPVFPEKEKKNPKKNLTVQRSESGAYLLVDPLEVLLSLWCILEWGCICEPERYRELCPGGRCMCVRP